MKRAVIAGATGAIGTALIQRLTQERIEVLVLCRKDSKRIHKLPQNNLVEIAWCALDETAAYIPTSGKSYDVFYHFAWEGTFGDSRNDMYMQNRNVSHALDAVHLAQRFGCHTFIGAGSQAEYGRVEGILTAKTPTFPENGYGIAKLCAGQMTRYECHQLGMRHIWARILSVYGPNDGSQSMVMSTIDKLKNGKVPSFTAGEQLWDYLYSGDAADAFYLLGERGVDGKIYPLGGGQAKPLKEYIKTIRDITAPGAKLGLGELPYAPNQVMNLCADITELSADTGWKPVTSFETGIRNILRSW